MNVTSGYGSGSGDAKEGDWITIAAAGRSGISSNQSIRADALFQIISHQSGIQDELQFTATVKYGRANTINILEDSSYSPSYRTFDAIRIAYNQASGSTSTNTSVGTYDGAMLQLRVGKCHPTSYSRIQIRMSNNNNYTGWDEYIHPAPVQGVLGAATSPNLTYLQENNDPKVIVEDNSRNSSLAPGSTGLNGVAFANEVFLEVPKKHVMSSSGTRTLFDSNSSKAHNMLQMVRQLGTRPKIDKAINSSGVTDNELGVYGLVQTATALIHMDNSSNYNDKLYKVCTLPDLTAFGGGGTASAPSGSTFAFPVAAFTLNLIGWQNYDDVGYNASNKFAFDITVEVCINQDTNAFTSHRVNINATRWLHAQKKLINDIVVWKSGSGTSALINVGFYMNAYQPGGSAYQQTGKYLHIEAHMLNNGNNGLVNNRTGWDHTNTGVDRIVYRQLRPRIVGETLVPESSSLSSIPSSDIVGRLGSTQGTSRIGSHHMTIFQTDTFLPEATYVNGERLKYVIETPTLFRPTFDQTGNWLPLAQVFAYTSAVGGPSAPSQNVVTACMTFKLEAADDFYDTQNHTRVQVVYGSVKVCGATANGGQRKVVIDIHRSTTSGDGGLTNPPPLIKRVFVTGQTNGNLQEYTLFVEVDDGLGNNSVPYFRIEMADNKANNGASTGGTSVNENTWVANGEFNMTQGMVGTPLYELNIQSGSFSHISHDSAEFKNNVAIQNSLLVNQDAFVDGNLQVNATGGILTGSAGYNINNSAGSLNTKELYIDGVPFVPGGYAEVEKTTFTLDAGFVDGDWLTIARAGDGTNRNMLRAEGIFIIHERSGSHHHSVVIRVGAKFSSGIYISVESSTWYQVPRILEVRVAYESTYDGSVLQLSLKKTGSGTFYLSHYQNLDEGGWDIRANGIGLSADNSPTVYVNDSNYASATPPGGSTSGLGHAYTKFKGTQRLDWDPKGDNSMSTSTKDHSHYGSTVEVNGGHLKLEGADGTVNDGYFNINGANQVSGIDMDGAGTAATGTTFNQKEGVSFDVECNYGNSNITALDFNIHANGTSSNNQGNGLLKARVLTAQSTGGDILVNAQDDVWIKTGTAWTQPGAPSGNGDIGLYAGRHMYLRAGDGSTMSSDTAGIVIGDSSNLRWTEVIEPLKVYDTTRAGVISALSDATGDNLQSFTIKADSTSASTNKTANGTLAYCRETVNGANGLICKVAGRNLNISSPPQVMEFMAAMKARNHTSASNQTVTPSSKVRWHHSTKAPSHFTGLHLTAYGQQTNITYQSSPFPLLVQGYTIHPFFTYANNPAVYTSAGVTGSATVSFEIWVATTTGSYASDWLTNTSWYGSSYLSSAGNDGIRLDQQTETATVVCKKISAIQRTVTHSSSVFNPWHKTTNTPTSASPESVKLTTPFIIPANTNFHVYFIERLITSNTGSYPSVNFLGTGSWGYAHWQGSSQDASPVGLDLWYTALNEI